MKAAILLCASLIASFAAAADHAITVGEFRQNDLVEFIESDDHGPVESTMIAEFHTMSTEKETQVDLQELFKLSEMNTVGSYANVASAKPCFLVRVLVDNEGSTIHDPNAPVEIMNYHEGLDLQDVYKRKIHQVVGFVFVIPIENGDKLATSTVMKRAYGEVQTTINSDMIKGVFGPTSMLRKKLKDYTNGPCKDMIIDFVTQYDDVHTA